MFEVKNKNTRTKVFLLLTLNIFHTFFSSLSLVDFEQVNFNRVDLQKSVQSCS